MCIRDRYNSVVAEAETEAWQKLIRVLTHEIMNSIAPVISLSETVAERATINGMNERDYAIMVQAMQTIHRRSKGLLDFVENYRQLTRLPLPTLRTVSYTHLDVYKRQGGTSYSWIKSRQATRQDSDQ